ncbi:L(+)-tartrate dehydratase subunit alpha [Wolinella succinogenes]|uniref:L(+)-tartrate dehydratase subunit alpha n=1 Tax=Wolinella succinogenes (strain ATCC 29543 / DSM 1740 / CCUG 13145 / JCM 31913 / LMG 7466 / NCTC 11488 / FDC 602W) TaxID=273121 RepID=Q7M8N4_WOLSU|nr:L(+)-tartrate dehydratase subunit alpha [Wolinella succinogenes]CAE10576.1 L-TARTRATE DEHYDRATASE, SUBUNIT A [Wolinella succinogenes]VEG80721.1 L(+)-tartrate dehydratase subunit alpha [Wolinella succinogenes]HCZ18746.1 L(+)-tartrate dehydratase subunit alpha [Helicobacter sp.]
MEASSGHQLMAETLGKFVSLVSKRLPDDVMAKLTELKGIETEPLAKSLYACMFENMEKAESLNRPTCQDTGVIQFFVRAGAKFPYLGELRGILKEATILSTKQAPLRLNAVEPFDEKNTGTNVGTKVPWIEWDIVSDDDSVEIEVYMAGGGCSLPGRSIVLPPLAGYEGAVKFVFDTIVEWGINACPPLTVGVGIGTCSTSAAKLSKMAMLRKLGSSNPHPRAAEMERRIQEGLDAIGLGPQGISGHRSVLGVHVEGMAHHPSVLGVGVTVGCWANRHGIIQFNKNLQYTMISHQGVEL